MRRNKNCTRNGADKTHIKVGKCDFEDTLNSVFEDFSNEYIIKLQFITPIHFGNGRLATSENFMYADILFSAFYKEAIKLNDEQYAEKLRTAAENSDFKNSDLMPFYNQTFFISKPILPLDIDRRTDFSLKKKFKKLKFLPINDLTAYLSGNYNLDNALDMLDSLGKHSVRTNVKINQCGDNTPFNVGIFTFNMDRFLNYKLTVETLGPLFIGSDKI